jgi:hypothetical protein
VARCFCLRTFSLPNIFFRFFPLGWKEGIVVKNFFSPPAMDEEEVEHISFSFHFHSVDLAMGRLSFGLRWIQRKRQKFSLSVNIQIGLSRCRFHPTGGFSHQRIGIGNSSSGQLR